MDKLRLLDLGLLSEYEVEADIDYMDRHWKSVKINLLPMADLTVPLDIIKEKDHLHGKRLES